MQTLMIWRHAKAVPWDSMPDDFSRPLNEIGQAHASAVAEWMKAELDSPDTVVSSPSQRTRETVAPLLELSPKLNAETHYLPQIYCASLGTILKTLDNAFAESDSVLIVGHNPGLEHLVFESIAESEYSRIKRLATGTLVIVEFEPDWFEGRGNGRIAHKVRGKKLVARGF